MERKEQNKRAAQAQQGDRAAAFALWRSTEQLLYMKARDFFSHYGENVCAQHGITPEDLRQECYFAFLDALRAYNPIGGHSFTSYLNYASINRFKACMGIQGTRRNPLDYADSMNAPAGAEEEDIESGELIPDEKAAEAFRLVEERATARYTFSILKKGLEHLTLEQETVIRKRYVERLTRPQIARILNITQLMVLKLENQALSVLRHVTAISSLQEEYVEAEAYRNTGLSPFLRWEGSSPEKVTERLEKNHADFAE